MDRKERQVIDELFGKLRQVDGKAPQRDAEAEAYIRQQAQAMPAAPYYMAQAMLVQEQALGNLQSRVQELESAAAQPAASGGFLGGLFGGGQPAPPARGARRGPAAQAQGPIPPQYMQQPGGMGAAGGSPWGGRPAAMGGGFLAGAMQTALGVAGGMMIASALTSAFDGGGEAEAATGAEDAAFGEEPPVDEPVAEDAAFEDFGGDAGGFDEPI